MPSVSVIIPTRNEVYRTKTGETVLWKTVEEAYTKAAGEVEIVVMFDGPPYQPLPEYPNLIRLELPQAGTKVGLNAAVKAASGKYFLKIDSHCMLSEGYDKALTSDMQDNWVVAPRMYILNAEDWCWQDERFYDHFMLPCPLTDPRLFRFQAGGHWKDRTRARLDVPVDENMKLHGSSFFMARDYYLNCLGGVGHDEMSKTNAVHSFSGEDIEISLKTWLGPWDGKVMVNKNAWYAHMHKGGERPRGWGVSNREVNESYVYTATYWMGDQWEGRVHNLDWLIERFYPVPTWPENWRELYDEWRQREHA